MLRVLRLTLQTSSNPSRNSVTLMTAVTQIFLARRNGYRSNRALSTVSNMPNYTPHQHSSVYSKLHYNTAPPLMESRTQVSRPMTWLSRSRTVKFVLEDPRWPRKWCFNKTLMIKWWSLEVDQILVSVPNVKSEHFRWTFGFGWKQSYCTAGPRLWNSLPGPLRQSETIATFKRHLKTFLFSD